ncbi:MAG: PepSY domain-containing protein [Ferruginibacter sp.]
MSNFLNHHTEYQHKLRYYLLVVSLFFSSVLFSQINTGDDFQKKCSVDYKTTQYPGIPKLISPAAMLEIAKKNFKQQGFEITISGLTVDNNLKQIYTVFNKITGAGEQSGKMEIIEIDAYTGTVIKLFDGFYGLMIR